MVLIVFSHPPTNDIYPVNEINFLKFFLLGALTNPSKQIFRKIIHD
jgi:hypothetical protein